MSVMNGGGGGGTMLACYWDSGKAVGSKGEPTSEASTGDTLRRLANGMLHYFQTHYLSPIKMG